MDDFERPDPPKAGSELETLNGFLDYHRATLLQKVAGVSDADLRRSPLAGQTTNPVPLNLLGLVKHLAYVERNWFQVTFMGITDLPVPWTKADPDADMRIEPDETTEAVLEFYREAVRRSRQIVQQALVEAGNETATLESRAKHPQRTQVSLRWIIVHMIEETARHNGHADLLRELTDGVTGE